MLRWRRLREGGEAEEGIEYKFLLRRKDLHRNIYTK
jgi:hypothetical protein